MKYNLNINQSQALKLGITNINQAHIFDLLTTASVWASPQIVKDTVYYWVARQTIANELALLNLKPDTIYRHLKKLENLGLINYIKIGKKDCIKMTLKGKSYLSENKDNSLKNDLNSYVGNKSELKQNSEINPSKFGNKSEKHSEINPTDHITNINHITNDHKKEIYKEKKEFSFNLSKKQSFDNLSHEYKAKLKKAINESKSSISYEYFENSCLANGYKYKNFNLAFITWNSKSVTREVTNIDKQKEDPFLMYLDFRKDGMSQEVAEVRTVHQSNMKYPSTKTFNEAIKKHEVANFVNIFDAIDEEYGTLEDEQQEAVNAF